MKWLFFLVFLFYLRPVFGGNENFTFTYNMAMRCKEHKSIHGYNYETFYKIDESTLTHSTVKKENTSVSYLEMHIAIQAASNGHILLSSQPFPGKFDPVYEIVVGGGGNKFTELRLNLKRNARSSTKTPGILSAIDFTAFYIKISDDGLVEFGREGDSLPLISYFHTHAIPIQYMSFASWTGVEAKFLYDCPAPGENDAISPDSRIVEPKLSNSDELKRSLLLDKLPSEPPSPIVNVKFGCKVTNVRFDALGYKMVTNLAVVMSWTDESLAWNPNKFNGTTRLQFRQGQIWRPKFYVYNSFKIDVFDTKNPDLISVVNSGEATFHFNTQVASYCSAIVITETNKWPHDLYTCFIIIEPWEVHEKIKITKMQPVDFKMKMYSSIDEVIKNGWDFKVRIDSILRPDLWYAYGYTGRDTILNNASDRYILGIKLTRQATTYNIAFYTPLLVLVTFVLMSFWDKPLEESRIMFYAGCAIVICLGLSYMDFLVPMNIMPSIMILYITVLGGVITALLVNTLMLTSTMENISKTSFMKSILLFWLLRYVFFLPTLRASKFNGGYTPQDDEDQETFPSCSNIEEMETEVKKTYADRKELAEVLDKIMFVVFSITFACMLSAHY